MSQYKTSAIILRTYDFKDFDKILVLYSRERGLIRAIAKGVKRAKSSVGERLEPLMAVNLIIYEGKNLDTVSQADSIDYFKALRKDLKKLTFSMCFAELAAAFATENDPNSEYFYEFLFKSLKELENFKDDDIIENLLVSFQFEIISQAGYKPMLDVCNACRKSLLDSMVLYFTRESALFICSDCAINKSNLIKIDLDLYKYLLNLHNKDHSLMNSDISTVLKAYSVMRDYIKTKTSFKFKTSELVEDICLCC